MIKRFIKDLKNYIKVTLNFFNYPLFAASFGFIMGIVLVDYLQLVISLKILFVILIYLILVAIIIRERAVRIVGIVFISLIFGIIRYQSIYDYPQNHIKNYYNVEAEILGTIKYTPEPSGNNLRMIVEVKSIRVKDSNDDILIKGSILLKASRYPEYKSQDTIKFFGKIEEPENFDTFDYRDYLKNQGIYATINGSSVKVTSREKNIFSVVEDFKLMLSHRIKSQIPEPHASLLLGILIGTRENMPEDFAEYLSITSTTHIIAVSGYNVSVLLGVFLSFAGKIPRRFTILISYFFLTLFILIVGLNNLPALRAAIMGYALLTAMIVGRKGGLISFLPLSACVLIYFNPLSFKLISFQLSFASTLGLILLNDWIKKTIKFVPEIFRGELAPTFAATFSTLPIILYNFGNLSLISPLVNMIVLPSVPIIMFVGFIYLLTLLLGNFLSTIFGFFVYLLLSFMVEVITFFGKYFEFMRLNLGDVGLTLIVGMVGFLIFISYKINVQNLQDT